MPKAMGGDLYPAGLVGKVCCGGEDVEEDEVA